MVENTEAHVQREAAPEEGPEGPEHLTCLLLSHLTDVVVDIIVKFFDFFFVSLKYMFYLVLSIIVFKYNSNTKCRHELSRKI